MNTTLDFLDAVKAGDLDHVRTILETAPELAQVRDEAGVSAVMLAAYYGQPDVAEELTRLHVDLDIFEAAALGRAERVAELLDRDPALVDSYSADSFTPLGFAAFFGQVPTVHLLLQRGADVNAASRNHMAVRPIHSAAAHRDRDVALRVATALIEHGADVNTAQHGGWTPLHQAAAHGHVALLELLLAHGADLDAVSDDGKTPRDMALEKDHAEATRLLEAPPRPVGIR